ncbi:MAG: hypothetical protein JSV56_03360 [Methanomassiliicoccales archaeon]|nr:MAG: hypothetical protein JSV56_03360 [Methanomassiliicoccales archaeon]
MPFDCPTCGKKGSVTEFKVEEFSHLDYANINIFTEDPSHTLDVLYLLPPWRCESCQSVLLRGRGDKPIKETKYKCKLCKKGKLAEFENAAVGELVVRDTFERVGQLTIDEAFVCNNCGLLRMFETGKEVLD